MVKKVRKAKKLPVVLNEDERLRLLAIPSNRTKTGMRNRVILQLGFNLGLRLAEMVDLKWKDIDFTNDKLMVRQGKGKKDRLLFIKDNNWRGENDKTALMNWKARQKEQLGKSPVYVFTTMSAITIKKRTYPAGEPIDRSYIQKMVNRYRKRAGIDHCSVHTLRHSFATAFYRKTKDIVKVKNALGHASINTTQVYLHLNGFDLEDAFSGDK
jgi:site-specific recombinase XerD